MAAVTAALIASAVIAAGSAAHTVESGRQAKREGEDNARVQKENQAALDNEAALQKNTEEQTKFRDEERNRTRGISAAQGGRSSTILTSPLGVTGAAPATANKTALGA